MTAAELMAMLRVEPLIGPVTAGVLVLIGIVSVGSASLDTARAARRAVGRARRRRQSNREFAAIAAAEADVSEETTDGQ